MSDVDVRRFEAALESMEKRLTKQIDELGQKVAAAAKFQDGFQAVSKVLTYACTIVAALAVVYGTVFR